jgi:hypothetical protein
MLVLRRCRWAIHLSDGIGSLDILSMDLSPSSRITLTLSLPMNLCPANPIALTLTLSLQQHGRESTTKSPRIVPLNLFGLFR